VVEDDGRRLRVAHAVRGGSDRLQLTGPARWEDASHELLGELGDRSGRALRPAIVVTHRARPVVEYLPEKGLADVPRLEAHVERILHQQGAAAWGWETRLPAREGDERCVVAATVEESVRDRWQERLAARGFRLEGIYPQLGTPLCALEPRLVELPTLALQVEKDSVAVMEVSGGGCRSIEVHARAHPITSFCERLIGIGCAEVLLCGGEDRLPQLGYEIARSSGTWIRLQRERGAEDEPGARPPMAILGGAYHAFGLTPVGAVACVPPAA